MASRLVAYLLAVEVLAVVLVTAGLSQTTTEALPVFGIIALLGLVSAELTRGGERVRRRFSDVPHTNMSSIWVLPAALLLPTTLAAATVVVLYLQLWLRCWYRARGVPPYRLVFNMAVVVLAGQAAAAVVRQTAPGALATLGELRSLAALAAAVLAYSVVNSGLVAVAFGLLQGRLNVRHLFGSHRENAVEHATVGLGLCVAVLLVSQPLLVMALLPALVLLHRCVLLRQLEEAAETDHKTGLLNSSAWTSRAAAELARAARDGTALGVLMIDLDHFKRINDAHGHLVGDRVLQLVAEVLRQCVRPYDLLARFGGEEFVVLLRDLSASDLLAVAERIRSRIRAVRVPLVAGDPGSTELVITVSIGAAHYPDIGPDLDDLIRAADVGLYAAKDGGRNQVQTVVGPASVFRADGQPTTRP